VDVRAGTVQPDCSREMAIRNEVAVGGLGRSSADVKNSHLIKNQHDKKFSEKRLFH
jgi:hypothetical protein